ncbi:MAG: hypothetical protein H0T42_27460 [Deltaproteobacteria bacterium]|nr:hypothetical protein [Deltaproteobacteria bacterium]
MKLLSALLLAAAGCDAGGSPDPEHMGGPDAGVTIDAAPDAPPVEPKPAFTAGTSLSGQLAVTSTGIRETFTIQGAEYLSVVNVGLTETGTENHCGIKLSPKFATFSSASTNTRQFKTIVIDLAGSTMLEDNCKWDDAYILQRLGDIFGNYVVGFAQARFTEDRPYLDIYLNASKGLGAGTASVVRAGAGSAYAMAADGSVTEVMVQPTPGTLLDAVYDF